ncbi:MAG: hypothetical protein EA361_17450 [Bacteroidetes bacterium]|nr:MAG: hypothetical protein EA361_17450 [Bacteroidota bacterium]
MPEISSSDRNQNKATGRKKTTIFSEREIHVLMEQMRLKNEALKKIYDFFNHKQPSEDADKSTK